MDVEELQRHFEIRGKVTISSIVEKFPLITLKFGNNSSAQITTYGAQILSWIDENKREQLFLGSRLIIEDGTAIRGGIPIIFPQFGPGILPSHGFARNQEWTLTKSGVMNSGEPFVELVLTESEKSLAIWPFRFRIVHRIILGQKLSSEIVISNLSDTDLTAQFAFHSYFRVNSIHNIELRGFGDKQFINTAKNGERAVSPSGDQVIKEFTDRIYCDAPPPLYLIDNKSYQGVAIHSEGMADAVVWNPWSDKCASFKDLAPDDYLKFICVERGAINSPLYIASGKHLSLKHHLSVI